jgi:hypothetical protein
VLSLLMGATRTVRGESQRTDLFAVGGLLEAQFALISVNSIRSEQKR